MPITLSLYTRIIVCGAHQEVEIVWHDFVGDARALNGLNIIFDDYIHLGVVHKVIEASFYVYFCHPFKDDVVHHYSLTFTWEGILDEKVRIVNLNGHNISLGAEKYQLFDRVGMIGTFRIRLISNFHDVANEGHFVAFFIVCNLVFGFTMSDIYQICQVFLRIQRFDY